VYDINRWEEWLSFSNPRDTDARNRLYGEHEKRLRKISEAWQKVEKITIGFMSNNSGDEGHWHLFAHSHGTTTVDEYKALILLGTLEQALSETGDSPDQIGLEIIKLLCYDPCISACVGGLKYHGIDLLALVVFKYEEVSFPSAAMWTAVRFVCCATISVRVFSQLKETNMEPDQIQTLCLDVISQSQFPIIAALESAALFKHLLKNGKYTIFSNEMEELAESFSRTAAELIDQPEADLIAAMLLEVLYT